HGAIRNGGIGNVIALGINFNDRLLVSLPLGYTWGTCQYLREALIPGATTIVETSFDTDRLIDVLEDEKISVWAPVVVLFERIADSPRFRDADFSNLRHVTTGRASLHLLKTWLAKGVRITQSYGLTETGGHATILYVEDAEGRMGSSGRAMMGCEVRIVDEDGRDLPSGEAGEVLIRGAVVMKGYLNKPEETARTMKNGWLWTGDIGVLDADGFLTIVDRSKDMLRSGGLNVYPAELERVLAGVDGLEEFTVIGVNDERWGETPMIVANGTKPLDVTGLKARAVAELADFKRPRYYVDYGKPLPRTVSGKVLKRELRLEFETVPDHAISLKD
ncbi:MAG: AMP-binding protein, partial [Sphingomonadales bacterium]